MYKYIDNYINTNHVTQPAPPPPLPLYASDLVVPFICKVPNYCRNVVYTQFVILAIGIAFSCFTTIV